MHTVLGPSQDFPLEHAKQDVDPLVIVNLPTEQKVHAVSGRSVVSRKEGFLALLNLPAGHCLQSRCDTLLNRPEEHATHACAPNVATSPLVRVTEPRAHFPHCFNPRKRVNIPIGQS
jgi:hypothetical protein